MDYFETIEKRFSCRSFLDKKISKEELDKLLFAAQMAPTACNFQPQRIIVIEDSEILNKLKEATRFTFDAKTILAICHDENVSWHRKNDNYDHGIVDASIVATGIALAATAQGLGSCFVCSMDAKRIQEILELPLSYKVDILLPIGYPSEAHEHNTRKPIDTIVSYK